MNIRTAKICDIDNNLLKLYKKIFNMHYKERKDIFCEKSDDELRNDLVNILNSLDEIIWVIEIDNVIIGYIDFKFRTKVTKHIFINQIMIDDKYRGKGYGKKLIMELVQLAKKNNFERVELNCWSFNENALKFYEKMGFISQRVILEKNLLN